MQNWKSIVLGGVAILTLGIATPAAAEHQHYLVTPGTCVNDIASGQTSKEAGEGGYHQYHHHVHKGQPGMVAFNNSNNPVSVDKGSCPE